MQLYQRPPLQGVEQPPRQRGSVPAVPPPMPVVLRIPHLREIEKDPRPEQPAASWWRTNSARLACLFLVALVFGFVRWYSARNPVQDHRLPPLSAEWEENKVQHSSPPSLEMADPLDTPEAGPNDAAGRQADPSSAPARLVPHIEPIETGEPQ